MVTKKRCVLCGHAVGQGDRHSKLNCPPKALGRDSQKARRRRLAKRRQSAVESITRGVVVAGTGVPKGASKG